MVATPPIAPSLSGGSSAANATQTVKFGDVYISHSNMLWITILGVVALTAWAIRR